MLLFLSFFFSVLKNFIKCETLVNNFCNDRIELSGIAGTVEDSISVIKKHNPDLVFLDIMLGSNPEGAFDVLRAFEKIDFKVVFTTSSKQTENILKALNKYGAKKYLLKPLDIDEVIEAVNAVKEEIQSKTLEDNVLEMRELLSNLERKENCSKLRIPVRNGIRYIPASDIVMLRSDSNDTVVFLNDGTTVRTSKNLKHFEEHCKSGGFLRTSRSYIINLKYVESYSSEAGGTIHLSCNCSAALSDKYADDFFSALGR